MKVELFSKPHCPLCDDAKEILRRVQGQVPFELVEVNIESDPALFARYRYDIPVVHIDGSRAFKHRVEEAELLQRLNRHRGTTVAPADPAKR